MTFSSHKRYLLILLLIVGILLTGYIVYHASHLGDYSFPLDDTWIHLTYARNLARHHSFTYYPGAPPSSGSTAPLYTAFLALGFLISDHEIMVGLAAGMLFYFALIILFYHLSAKFLSNNYLMAAGLTLFLISDWRILWSALSGMETTCFIFILLLMIWFARKREQRNYLITGIMGGIAIWIRPESVILAGLLFIYFSWPKEYRKKGTIMFLCGYLPFVFLYFAFNLLLSGRLLPNSFYAKGEFYRQFSRLEYIWDAMKFFFEPHVIPFIPFAFASLYKSTKQLIKGTFSLEAIFCYFPLILIAAYAWRIPLLFERGRYLQPAIPFLYLAASPVLLSFMEKIAPNRKMIFYLKWVPLLLILACMILAFFQRFEYYVDSKYIYIRHVTTARWVNDNIPEGEILATHDVGAMGFYSGHPIFDLAGLVTEGTAKFMGHPDKQKELLAENNVNYLVMAPDWEQLVPLLTILPRQHLFPYVEDYRDSAVMPMLVFHIKPDANL